MALTNNQKQEALRKRRAASGQNELRGVWVTAEEERVLKPQVRETLKRMRKGT
jgi:uncharacterized lipoprotein YddW (UPF0748 family)